MRAVAIATALVLICSSVALAVPSATLTLESTKNGQTVAPGTVVDWTIRASVSTGDNAGLALVSVDLLQNAENPAAFDLPQGSDASIDSAMQHFNRPMGIANPGEGGASTGYIGSQRGDAGHKNLIQIGGGQNTFGTALASGTGMGESAVVVSGVGQSAPQVVLSGSFVAPSTPGAYTLHLENGLVNVLNQISPPPTPPAYWTVTAATVSVTGASITISVGPTYTRGDVNCDGAINTFDIDPFVVALTNPTQYAVLYAGCDINSADANCDGAVNTFDIDPFVLCLTSGCPECSK